MCVIKEIEKKRKEKKKSVSFLFFFGKEKKLFKCRRLHTNKEGEGSYAEMKTKDVRHPPLGVDISFRSFDSPQKKMYISF